MKNYKSFLLATAGGIVGAGGLLSPLAQAADLPVKAAPMPVVIPAANWTGWYVGLNVGGGREQGETRIGGAGYTPDNTTFIGGGQIGYNWQSGNFLYGWEADISGLGSKSTQQTYNTGYITYGNHISWLSTYRGRWGLVVNDTMMYMTGGLAVGGVKNTYAWEPGDGNYSSSRTRWGWVAGVGIEHLINRNWTAGIETLFVDLGRYGGAASEFCSGVSGCADASTFTGRFSNQAMIARLKLNYKW
jgi:outer membrane immunogenic protein